MDRPKTLYFYRNHLPHWEVENGTYFVTLRLHKTLPRDIEQRLRLLRHEYASDQQGPILQQKIFTDMEHWLDNLSDRRHLAEPAVAQTVVDSIRHRQQANTWDMHEFVVMPNHVHMLFNIVNGSLKPAMTSFKRWTARQANALLNPNQRHFWQEDWFDHWVRSHEEYLGLVDYIRLNPVKAGLVKKYQDWPYGSK